MKLKHKIITGIVSTIALAGFAKYRYEQSYVCHPERDKEAIEQLGNFIYEYTEFSPLISLSSDSIEDLKKYTPRLIEMHLTIEATDYPKCAKNVAELFLGLTQGYIYWNSSFVSPRPTIDHALKDEDLHESPYLGDYPNPGEPMNRLNPIEYNNRRLRLSHARMKLGQSTKWDKLKKAWDTPDK